MAAIVHLVASSVPELAATDVTLVDQAGSLLNSPYENAESAASTRQFEYTRKMEESYQQRIMELLEPMLGPGRVRATVTADLDFTVTEETRENYDPQKTAVRSEQTSKESRKGGDPSASYVAKLFSKGDDAILKKIGEEATETVMAAKDARHSGDTSKVVYEVADLWFHSMVLLAQLGLTPQQVLDELARREGLSGLDEKAARKE